MTINNLVNKRILLGVTGGIAAYKAADLVRRLQDQGADVRVVMTRAATEFITPLTMQALSGHPTHIDMLDAETESVMGHIELARWSDLILIAPASADFIARFCGGHGDDLLTTICLAAETNIAIAPAMNQAMWSNPQTQMNIAQLEQSEVLLMGPAEGIQACGETGQGRLLDVDQIVQHTISIFPSEKLTGKKVVITAGPTRESIDPVRFISNHSSGKQGYALAEAAVEAGADVVVISGPTNLDPVDRARTINTVSADDMYAAVMSEIADCDVFIGVAAVADFKPVMQSEQKLKKTQDSNTMTIELIENPDIIASVAALSKRPFCVGFAAETEHLLGHARLKLQRKKLDLIVANNVADSSIGFNSDNNRITLVWNDGESDLPAMSKRNIAAKIVNHVSKQLDAQKV